MNNINWEALFGVLFFLVLMLIMIISSMRPSKVIKTRQRLIEQMEKIGSTRPATLYWGGRRPSDMYLDAWVKEKLAAMPNLTYVPVISDALPEDAWTGRTGFVHSAAITDVPDMSGYQVYACGTLW